MSTQDRYQPNEWHACDSSAAIVIDLVQQLLAPRSVLDVGCGSGNWLDTFRQRGLEDYCGLDLSPHQSEFKIDAEHFRQTNLDQPIDLGRRFDLVMSLEVAEHLLPTSGPTFVDSLLRHGDVVLFSAAIPEQKGTKHINTRWQQYWIDLFVERGLQPDFTLRNMLWSDTRLRWWYRQNILLFSREPLNLPVSNSPVNIVHPEHYLNVSQRLERAQQEIERMNSPRSSGQLFARNVKRYVSEKMKKVSGRHSLPPVAAQTAK